jgi:hypothetical protein
MGLLAMMDMSESERTEHVIQTMEPSELPPLLRLLDVLLATADADDAVGLLDLAGESVGFGHFLLGARLALTHALEQLQASMAAQMVRGHRGPLTSLVLLDPSSGQMWTRRRVRECVECVERRMGAAAVAEARQVAASDDGPENSTPLGATAAGDVLREFLAARTG